MHFHVQSVGETGSISLLKCHTCGNPSRQSKLVTENIVHEIICSNIKIHFIIWGNKGNYVESRREMQIDHTVISLYNLCRFCGVDTEDSSSYLYSLHPRGGLCIGVLCVCACVRVLEGEYLCLDIFNVISRYI